ncbi:10568_t:CDS:2, partial [Entrophospora sp. SA101]
MSTHPRQRSQSTSHYSTHTGFHSRSIDEPMLPLINLLNKHNDYVTTSSCSGRIAVYCV